jgi:hypothetical protein
MIKIKCSSHPEPTSTQDLRIGGITPFSTISKRVFNLYIGIYALKYHPLGGNENLTIPSFSSRIPKKSWG